MSTVISLPPRSEVNVDDTWNLSKLFGNDDEWESSLDELEGRIGGYSAFKGTLGQNADRLVECLKGW